ncbi:hypothetical protein KEM44_04605 (plasmid) [Sinorhizobium meliloti]|nr:hypothetical protein KEM44_04605 [Sinorhizobium meliloti]
MLFNMADKYFGLHRWLWEQSDKDCEGGVGYPATSPVGNGGTVHIAGSDPRGCVRQVLQNWAVMRAGHAA